MDPLIALASLSELPIDTQVLLGILKEYRRPYDKIMEWVGKGYLSQVRKGLYVTTDKISPKSPEPFLIANHLYGPSHISLDSALFHWGLIPERVFETTSVTNRASKKVIALGRTYSYTHLPMPYCAVGIRRLEITAAQSVLIAGPEKCLCDKIVATPGIQLRSQRQAKTYLLDDLRIDRDVVRQFDTREMMKWVSIAPKRESIGTLIETIAEL